MLQIGERIGGYYSQCCHKMGSTYGANSLRCTAIIQLSITFNLYANFNILQCDWMAEYIDQLPVINN